MQPSEVSLRARSRRAILGAFVWWAPLLLAALFALLEKTTLFQKLEHSLWDEGIKLRSHLQEPPDTRLVFVAVDDLDIERLKGWPINRRYYGDFSLLMEEGGAGVVVYDLLLDQPREAEGDRHFAEVAGDSATPPVMGVSIAPADENLLQAGAVNWGWPAPPEVLATAWEHTHLIRPYPQLRPHVREALVNVNTDADGVARRVPMYVVVDGQVLPTLALRALMTFWRIGPAEMEIRPGDAILLSTPDGQKRIPINAQGEYQVNFRYDLVTDPRSRYYEMTTFRGARFTTMLREYLRQAEGGQRDPRTPEVKGNIVLLGVTATAGTDLGPSPFQAKSPQPLVHLNVLDNVLKQDFLRFPPRWLAWVLFLLVAYLSIRVVKGGRFWWSVLAPLGLLVAYPALAFASFAYANVVWPVTGPAMAFASLHVALVGRQVLEERAARLRLRQTFGAYVSTGILEKIYQHPEGLKLGGGYKAVTIFFSDIRSFTTMTEILDSEHLVAQLNEYFTDMVACIQREGGTLHKFIGDAIMAVWGDVTDEGGPALDAERGVAAALAMRSALVRMNRAWEASGRPAFHTGMGLNHGRVIVGNIGAPQRMEFTVIGDAVNLASRLEGLTKRFGVEIIVGESVYRLIQDKFVFRPLGRVQVAGKTVPVAIYEPLARAGEPPEGRYATDWLKDYEAGLSAIEAGDYATAERRLAECVEREPGDKAAGLWLRHTRECLANPAEAEFALRLTEK